MVYKFIAIELKPNETAFYTYDMFCSKYGITKSFFKKGLTGLADLGIINYEECSTENLELYTAILNQDYDRIQQIADDFKSNKLTE